VVCVCEYYGENSILQRPWPIGGCRATHQGGGGGVFLATTHIIVPTARKAKTTRTKNVYFCGVTSNHGVQLLHALAHQHITNSISEIMNTV